MRQRDRQKTSGCHSSGTRVSKACSTAGTPTTIYSSPKPAFMSHLRQLRETRGRLCGSSRTSGPDRIHPMYSSSFERIGSGGRRNRGRDKRQKNADMREGAEGRTFVGLQQYSSRAVEQQQQGPPSLVGKKEEEGGTWLGMFVLTTDVFDHRTLSRKLFSNNYYMRQSRQ